MSDLDNTLDDLAGFDWIPGIAEILKGARILRAASRDGRLDLDATPTALTLLANPHGPDLPEVLSLLVQDLTNPATNPTLAVLPDDVRKDVQRLGETHVLETAYAPQDAPNEAAGLIAESEPIAQVDPVEVIRQKNAARNRRSEHPYPK